MPDRRKRKATSLDRPALFAADCLSSRNEEMQRCIELTQAASRTSASVLIHGESGTGKNLLAETIHHLSPRAARACITINCSAIPENLLENELFGHDQGAFSGTERARRGKFEVADGGTLILDEVAGMSLSAQAKVLRAVECGEFERAGGKQTLRADVRIISITNQDLPALVREGRFREDLYYRLNEVTIHVPALRERREDLRDIANGIIREFNEKFGKSVNGISQIAMDILIRYDFPGNIREMKGLVKRAMTVAKGDLLWLEDLGVRVEVPAETNENPEEAMSLAAMEKRHIQQVLDYTRNKTRTCEILKVSRPTLDRKIRIYGLRVT